MPGRFLDCIDVGEDAVQRRADDRVGDCFQVGVPADVAGLRRRLESAHQSVMMGAGELVVERIAIQRVVTTNGTP